MKRWLCMLLCLLLCLAGCDLTPAGADPTPTPADTPAGPAARAQALSLLWNEEESLHPLLTGSEQNRLLGRLTHDTLFLLGADLGAEPCLALAGTPDAEYRVWTVELRQDVSFSDGTKLTAADVVYSLALALEHPESYYHARLSGVETVEAADAYTVEITLSAPNALFLSLLDIPVVKAGDDSKRPAGTGRYGYFEEEGVLSLIFRPDWTFAGGTVTVREIGLVAADSTDDAVGLFTDGLLDVYALPGGGTTQESYWGPHNKASFSGGTLCWLGVSAKEPLLDETVRQALSLAIDREALVDGPWQKTATALSVPLPSGWGELTGGTVAAACDTAGAKTLLESAGAEPAEDGVYGYTPENGKWGKLSFTLLVSNGGGAKVQAAKLIAAQAALAGIGIEVKSLPAAEYQEALEKGDFDLYIASATLTADVRLETLVGTGGSLNFGGYSAEALDNALLALRRGEEGAADALQALLEETLPVIPLCEENMALLSRSELDLTATPRRGDPYYGLQYWLAAAE